MTLYFQNNFLGVFGVKMEKKALFGPNFCKSLGRRKDEYKFRNDVFIFK